MNARVLLLLSTLALPPLAEAQILHAGGGSILGSTCVGLDCGASESFGFDLLRLKESNVRLHFDDTSSSASFPNNDWRILINDSTNGGAEYFAVEDSTAGEVPFRIEAGAGNNALRVDASGEVGIRTANPGQDLHVFASDTPTIRFDQAGMFGSQIWDVGANEANFFIRDLTSGDILTFRIRPSARRNSMIAADNGLGVAPGSGNDFFPATTLHVRDTRGSTQLLVEELNAAVAARTLFRLANAGNTKFEIENTDAGNSWAFTNSGSDFRISLQNSGVVEFSVDNSGDAFLPSGTLTQNSDRNAKEAIVPVDSVEILAAVTTLPVSTWQYKDQPDVRHIGPMAQDFHAAFGVGASPTGISSIDTGGVALAAIQGLAEENERLRVQNTALEQRVTKLERRTERLAELEALVLQLATTTAQRVAVR